MKGLFANLACLFLLLFAQQAALTHAAWHATRESPPAQQDGKGKVSFQGSLCTQHLSFSQVLGGANATAVAPPTPDHFVERIEYHGYSYDVEVRLSFLTRVPPVLL